MRRRMGCLLIVALGVVAFGLLIDWIVRNRMNQMATPGDARG